MLNFAYKFKDSTPPIQIFTPILYKIPRLLHKIVTSEELGVRNKSPLLVQANL